MLADAVVVEHLVQGLPPVGLGGQRLGVAGHRLGRIIQLVAQDVAQRIPKPRAFLLVVDQGELLAPQIDHLVPLLTSRAEREERVQVAALVRLQARRLLEKV